MKPSVGKQKNMVVFSLNRSLKTEEDELVTTAELALALKLSVKVVLNMASNGQIPYYKMGRRNRYKLGEVKALLLKEKRGTHGN